MQSVPLKIQTFLKLHKTINRQITFKTFDKKKKKITQNISLIQSLITIKPNSEISKCLIN